MAKQPRAKDRVRFPKKPDSEVADLSESQAIDGLPHTRDIEFLALKMDHDIQYSDQVKSRFLTDLVEEDDEHDLLNIGSLAITGQAVLWNMSQSDSNEILTYAYSLLEKELDYWADKNEEAEDLDAQQKGSSVKDTVCPYFASGKDFVVHALRAVSEKLEAATGSPLYCKLCLDPIMYPTDAQLPIPTIFSKHDIDLPGQGNALLPTFGSPDSRDSDGSIVQFGIPGNHLGLPLEPSQLYKEDAVMSRFLVDSVAGYYTRPVLN